MAKPGGEGSHVCPCFFVSPPVCDYFLRSIMRRHHACMSECCSAVTPHSLGATLFRDSRALSRMSTFFIPNQPAQLLDPRSQSVSTGSLSRSQRRGPIHLRLPPSSGNLFSASSCSMSIPKSKSETQERPSGNNSSHSAKMLRQRSMLPVRRLS